jgi:restriction endonuclease S subunit
MIGSVARVPQSVALGRLTQDTVKLEFKKRDQALERYLYWLLQTQHCRAYCAGHATGSAVVGLSREDFLAYPVPALNETRSSIVSILEAIDDRVRVLHETNGILEAIAQALFKSWFVDFDPVRAKAEGREPEGMDPATAAIFPSEFEESELGLIPKGWQIDEIGKVGACVGGATPSTKEPRFWDDPVHHWVTPKDLSGLQSPVLIDTERKVSEAGLAKISSGLLPIGTLLLSSRAPIGYLAIAHVPTAINQGFIAMLPGGQLPASYLLFWTKLNMDAIKQKANGSTFMEISKSAFRPIKLVVPSSRVVSEFDSICRPLLDRIAENERQRLQLAQLRDVLLPRLISGKMRLPEANAPMQAAQVARPNSVDR